jgi:hypothetical protein
MDEYIGVGFDAPPEKYEEWSKEVDWQYGETYDTIKAMHPEDFSDVAMIKTLTKFKTDQVACLIGYGLTDYDKKILAGVIERHIVGVLYKE